MGPFLFWLVYLSASHSGVEEATKKYYYFKLRALETGGQAKVKWACVWGGVDVGSGKAGDKDWDGRSQGDAE